MYSDNTLAIHNQKHCFYPGFRMVRLEVLTHVFRTCTCMQIMGDMISMRALKSIDFIELFYILCRSVSSLFSLLQNAVFDTD